jgi:hypothetical protein
MLSIRAGRSSGPYYTSRYTNAGRKPISVATNGTFVTVNLYPRPPEVVVDFATHPGLIRQERVSMSPHMHDPECDFPRIHLPRGWVNNGKKRDIREHPFNAARGD